MDAEDTLMRLARLEAQHEETRHRLAELQQWTQGEIQSCMQAVNATSAETVRLDSAIRGATGQNGLQGRLRLAEERLARWQWWTRWAVGLAATAIVGLLVRLVHGYLSGP